jgi:hypothetical protein
VKGYKIIYPLFIIPINGKFKAIWDLTVIVVVFWITLSLPWEIAFPEDKLPFVGNSITLFFLFDLIISFRTSFINEDSDEIIDSKKIAL